MDYEESTWDKEAAEEAADEYFYSEVERRLWNTMTGRDDKLYDIPDRAFARLVESGETFAEAILNYMEEAILVHYDNGGRYRPFEIAAGIFGGKDNIPFIRRVLKEIGGDEAQKALILLCLIDDVDATERLKRTLGELGTPEAVHALSRYLSFRHPDVAEAATIALRRHWAKSSKDDLPTLVALLTGNSPDAAIAAADALGKIGADEAVKPLIALIFANSRISSMWVEQGRTYRTLRSAAAQALGCIGDHRALDALVMAIGTDDQWTSEAAIDAVVALGGDSRAVVPILQASLPVEGSSRDWNFDGRIAAVQRMGPQSFGALVSAATDPNWGTRSLALRALTEIVEAASTADDERMKQRERAAACGVAGLTDPEASVRVAAIKLVSSMNIPNLVNYLVPLIGDAAEDEFNWSYRDGNNFNVGEAAVEALPDNDEALESLRQALIDGSLNPIEAWVFNNYDEQKRGSARHAEVLVSCILEKAKRGDEEAIDALRYPATTSVLKSLGRAYLDEAEEVLDAFEQEAVFGRTLLRWLYQVGSEFRDTSGAVWKIVRRIPETDAWHSLIFDVTHSGSKAVRQNTRQSWWNMSVVASLVPVEPGTFEKTVRTFEEQKAQEARVAALKARHGNDPRLVSLPEIATVQQFADVVGVTAADVQKSAGKHGKLLGHRERIAPDLLAALSDDFNVIFAHEDTV